MIYHIDIETTTREDMDKIIDLLSHTDINYQNSCVEEMEDE